MNPPDAPNPKPVFCDRCPAPARSSDVALARDFPGLKLSILCNTCARAEEAEDRRRLEEQRKRSEHSKRLSLLETIPPEIRRTDPSHPDFNLGLWLRVEGWLPSAGYWLGIVGGSGQCKTRCIGLLAQSLILAGHRLMWSTAIDFQDRVDDLRSDERAIKNEAHDYFREARRSPILVLDDFGKNTWTPTMEKNLFGILDHRKTHDLPVLWSANTHPLDFLRSGQMSKDRAAAIIGRMIEASTILTL